MSNELLSWQITRGCRLAWRVWDEEYVVYNTASGDTHILDLITGEALKCLEDSPASLEQLAARLAVKLDLGSQEITSQYLTSLISKLHESGLIEPAR